MITMITWGTTTDPEVGGDDEAADSGLAVRISIDIIIINTIIIIVVVIIIIDSFGTIIPVVGE